MKRFSYFLFLLTPVIMMSCQKELSSETGSLPGDSTTTPIGNTCVLGNILEQDLVTGTTGFAYISTFNTAHKVINIEVVDSSRGIIFGSFPVSYPAGRIQLDPVQYFVTGADGKVTEFHGYENPEDRVGSKQVVKYTYNAAGQLALRTVTYDSIPNYAALQFKFTYSAGNLLKEEAEYYIAGTYVRFGTIDYTFDATKTIKNSVNLYGAAFELVTFQTAANVGAGNVSPATKAVVTQINPQTGVPTIGTSNFSNYVIDSKGYVQSFNLTGDDFDAAGLYAGNRYKLTYNCY